MDEYGTPKCVQALSNITTTSLTCGWGFTPYIFNNDTKVRFKILSGALILISVLGSLESAAVCFAMITDKSMRKILINKLLIVLMVLSLLLSIVGLPVYAHYTMLLSEGRFCCDIALGTSIITYTFALMCETSIAFINFQLYLSINQPFWYSSLVNKRATVPLLIGLNIFWLVMNILSSLVYLEWWAAYRQVTSAFVISVYVTMWFLLYSIYKETKTITKRANSNQSLQNERLTCRTLKLATSILLCFGLCYLPYTLLSVYILFNGITPSINTYYDPWGETLTMVTCIFNPILYCIRLKWVRRRVRIFLKLKNPSINATASTNIQTTNSIVSNVQARTNVN